MQGTCPMNAEQLRVLHFWAEAVDDHLIRVELTPVWNEAFTRSGVLVTYTVHNGEEPLQGRLVIDVDGIMNTVHDFNPYGHSAGDDPRYVAAPDELVMAAIASRCAEPEPEPESDPYDRMIERARQMGREHGEAAASWFFDGNTPEDVYRRTLQGIRECDPAVYDTFPSSPLSGEWADGMTLRELARACGIGWPSDPDDLLHDAATQYEDAYGVAVSEAIEDAAIRALS